MNELEGSSAEVAKRLLGSYIIRTINGNTIMARIVETEAYDQFDAASHSYKGRTPRTDVMFGPAGHLYVYFTYGMHYCCNVVTGKEGEGSAVLIRAVEIIEGASHALRKANGVELSNGPAKLCQALGITKDLNGHDLSTAPVQLVLQPPADDDQIIQTTRIGIKQAIDTPWRFYLRGSAAVSKR